MRTVPAASTEQVRRQWSREEREAEGRRRRHEHPLRYARLWDQPLPATSQRRAYTHLGPLVTIVCGGNRSGKSTGAAQIAVAHLLGRDHPDVVAWAEANGFPLTEIPRGPGRIYAVAIDSGDSREYVRPNIARYLPAGCTWRNRDGHGEAEVVTPDGGACVFKSVDQGRDSFQGTAIRFAWFDEEPRDQGVVNETLMRLVDQRGRLVISMTPLDGYTWLYRRWVETVDPDVAVHEIWGEHNPHVPQEQLERVLRQYGEHEQAARRRGAWTVLEGRVYAFRRDLHVVSSPVVPREWPRYVGIDFGTRNPACWLWAALDPRDDTLVVYREHYQAEWTIAQHAEHVRALEEGEPEPEMRWADPADAGARLTLITEHDIATVEADKDVRDGINAVAERLQPDVEGRPHLLVSEACPNLIRELEQYRWVTASGHADGAEKPLKQADHAVDALRYLVMGVRQGRFGVA